MMPPLSFMSMAMPTEPLPENAQALHNQAEAMAERAQNWLHGINPNYPGWDDLHDMQRAAVIQTATSLIAFHYLMHNPKSGVN